MTDFAKVASWPVDLMAVFCPARFTPAFDHEVSVAMPTEGSTTKRISNFQRDTEFQDSVHRVWWPGLDPGVLVAKTLPKVAHNPGLVMSREHFLR